MKRVAIITGSTRGIGFATAAEFLKNGDRVVLFCRHRAHVMKAAQALAPFRPSKNILPFTGDVRSERDVKRIVAGCIKHFGRIDILINNAGIATYRSVEETSEKKWDNIIDTNLKGTFLFMRHVLPVMKKQGSGAIINISSALGETGEANFSAYCASKFGVIGLTQSAADEMQGSGIRIYAVLPCAVNTSILEGVDLDLDPSEVLSPEYVAGKVFETAGSRKNSGTLFKVYS